MRVIPNTKLRRNLASALEKRAADHEPLLVKRDGRKPAAVLVSLEDFASLEDMQFLLRSPRNAERRLESIAELEAGRGEGKSLISVKIVLGDGEYDFDGRSQVPIGRARLYAKPGAPSRESTSLRPWNQPAARAGVDRRKSGQIAV